MNIRDTISIQAGGPGSGRHSGGLHDVAKKYGFSRGASIKTNNGTRTVYTHPKTDDELNIHDNKNGLSGWTMGNKSGGDEESLSNHIGKFGKSQ